MPGGIRPTLHLRNDEAAVFLSALRHYGIDLRVSPEGLARAFEGRRVDMSPEEASIFLQALTAVDEYQMGKAGPDRPRVRNLIRTRQIRYQREDPTEWWVSYREAIEAIQATGVAEVDCEDLGTMYAAELRVDGWDTEAFPFVYFVTPRLSHVVVGSPGYTRKNSGNFVAFDPSRLAGMGKE